MNGFAIMWILIGTSAVFSPARAGNASMLVVGGCHGTQISTTSEAAYRLRVIVVLGADSLGRQQALRILGLGKKTTESGLSLAANRLLRVYSNRGRIRASVRPAIKKVESPDSGDALIDVEIAVTEGPVFLVRRLEFVGNEITRDALIRRRVLLQEGEPYSEELLEKSLQKINDLRLFHGISKGDVAMTIDENEHFVDLRVTMKEKGDLRSRSE